MPKLKEAAVAISGRIVDVETVTEFGTDKYDGVKVLVATGDGHVSLKLNPERAEELRPDFGQTVAWWVRYGAYANRERGTDAQNFAVFVRLIDPADLDRFAQSLTAKPKAA